MNYLYRAWLRDNALHSDEQDHEWPACILIDAEMKEKAIERGNQLANKRLESIKTEIILLSNADEVGINSKNELQNSPKVKYGVEATNDGIIW